MLNLGESVYASSSKKHTDLCGHSTKTLAATAAATVAAATASAGKQSNKMADTSCHHLSKRDLSYFSSERFKKTLKLALDKGLAKEYGELIASRKRVQSYQTLRQAWEVVDAIIYVDIFEAHYDGHPYFWDEVRDLFKGYRSQALREMKKSKGFNSLVYRELAKTLEDKKEMRSFLRAISAPVLRKEPML